MTSTDTEPTTFLWTGGPDQTEDPAWVVNALEAGDIRIVNSGTPDVRLATARGQIAHPGDWLVQRGGEVLVITDRAEPSGCRYCGISEREHMQRWNAHVGWHKWIAPTQEQRKRRMKARRHSR